MSRHEDVGSGYDRGAAKHELLGRAQGPTCDTCEYFDRHFGDCLNGRSPRFQTSADQTCGAHYQSST